MENKNEKPDTKTKTKYRSFIPQYDKTEVAKEVILIFEKYGMTLNQLPEVYRAIDEIIVNQPINKPESCVRIPLSRIQFNHRKLTIEDLGEANAVREIEDLLHIRGSRLVVDA